MQLELADRVEIRELYDSYPIAFDKGDAAAWADHFAPDGRFFYQGEPITGTLALREFYDSRHADLPGMRHFMANLVIEATEGGARGQIYTLVFRQGDDGALRIRTIGSYADELVRLDIGWRFLERRFQPWLADDLADRALEFAAVSETV
jgi:ketosteroid isomerase-like protein